MSAGPTPAGSAVRPLARVGLRERHWYREARAIGRVYVRNRPAVVGAVLLLGFGLIAALAPLVAPADPFLGGPGLVVELPAGVFDRQTVEAHGLVSRDIPDRVAKDDADTGFGLFTRYAAEKAGWRAHLVAWRARDFVKREGDTNYGSLREDGRLVSLRHYFETGLTRTYYPAEEVGLELSARFHRVDTYHDYSFRILATVDFEMPLRVPRQP